MSAAIVARSESSFTVQVEIPYAPSMLEFEQTIQDQLNQAGVVATQEALQQFDTDGSPIRVGSVKFTSKGQLPKDYQTPYGVATVARHVYQDSQGGKTYCPLDRDARIVVSSTPRFAKVISHKYAEFGSGRVTLDLAENHGRTVARSFVQNVADAVATVALAKEESWQYALPALDHPVTTIAVGLDGTCLLMCEDGWREAMVGTIAFYDRAGERQHTIYMAATPEYGKATFLDRIDRELQRVKALYPRAQYVGLADGAKGNWEFLQERTAIQIVDFYHAAEYLSDAADILFSGRPKEKAPWLEGQCHSLKHEVGAARAIVKELKRLATANRKANGHEDVEAAITYYSNQNQAGRMNYGEWVAAGLPIGSGVTEAACKVIVKQRLCGSGMKWKEPGAAAVLSVRCLAYTTGRWSQFWSKIDRYGFPVADAA
jgi:hypothetical protein